MIAEKFDFAQNEHQKSKFVPDVDKKAKLMGDSG